MASLPPQVNLSSLPQAQLLVDLSGIKLDLDFVHQRCSFFLAHLDVVKSRPSVRISWPGDEPERLVPDFRLDDYHILDAFLSAAIVRYGRCFATGIRAALSPACLKSLDPSLRDAHEYFMGLRNRFIAHSVGRFEDCSVVASVQSGLDGSHLITGVSVYPGMTLLTSEKENDDLQKLASAHRTFIEDEIRLEEARVLAFVQTLSEQQLVELGVPHEIPPTRGDEKRPRHKPREARN